MSAPTRAEFLAEQRKRCSSDTKRLLAEIDAADAREMQSNTTLISRAIDIQDLKEEVRKYRERCEELLKQEQQIRDLRSKDVIHRGGKSYYPAADILAIIGDKP